MAPTASEDTAVPQPGLPAGFSRVLSTEAPTSGPLPPSSCLKHLFLQRPRGGPSCWGLPQPCHSCELGGGGGARPAREPLCPLYLHHWGFKVRSHASEALGPNHASDPRLRAIRPRPSCWLPVPGLHHGRSQLSRARDWQGCHGAELKSWVLQPPLSDPDTPLNCPVPQCPHGQNGARCTEQGHLGRNQRGSGRGRLEDNPWIVGSQLSLVEGCPGAEGGLCGPGTRVHGAFSR